MSPAKTAPSIARGAADKPPRLSGTTPSELGAKNYSPSEVIPKWTPSSDVESPIKNSIISKYRVMLARNGRELLLCRCK